MKQKKIAFFHAQFPIGSVEKISLSVAKYVSQFGYDVYFFVGTLDRNRVGADVPFHFLQLPNATDINSPENAEYMATQINELGIQVCIIPCYILKTLNYIKSKTPCCKYVYALHNIPLWEQINRVDDKKRAYFQSLAGRLKWLFMGYFKYVVLHWHLSHYKSMYRSVYDAVDAYVVLCESYKVKLIHDLQLPPDHKVYAIHNPELIIENPNLQKKKQLLSLGRMTYADKRLDRLLEIWQMISKEFPEWELVLVGSGSEAEKLQQYAKQLRLPRYRFVGHTNEPEKYYQEASVICLTSTFEGWPLSLTEAQANGVVPIAFDCTAGVTEILSPSGVNGLLIPPFDKKAYAEALTDLLKNPMRLKEMQQNVIEKTKDYSIDRVGQKWIHLFEELLAQS